MTSTINASTSSGIVQTADTSGVLALQGSGVTFLTGASGQTTALAGGTQTSGTGIAFPATQNPSSDANTLDDYEEGTWSPGISFGNASVGVTYGNRIGNYTKVGNRVILSCYFSVTSLGSSTGGLHITGLPFTVATQANGGYTAVSIWATSVSVNGGSITGYTIASTTEMDINFTPTTANGGGAGAVQNTNCSAPFSIMVSVAYIAA